MTLLGPHTPGLESGLDIYRYDCSINGARSLKLLSSQLAKTIVLDNLSLHPRIPMHQNKYKKLVFLENIVKQPNYKTQRVWTEHQEMQVDFLHSRGFCSSSNVLDIGCGALRLGVKLIPELDTGWYFGQDINIQVLELGRKVLEDYGVDSSRFTLMDSDAFDLSLVDRNIDIAFSNSVFSHLDLNSIFICLRSVREKIKPTGVYYSTFFKVANEEWTSPHPRNKWGREFKTYPNRDPYHYPEALLSLLAKEAGFEMSLAEDYGHPTQTMACFRPIV